MPKITQITYERVFNLGNYQSERIGLVASIDEDEQHLVVAAFDHLKESVANLHTKGEA